MERSDGMLATLGKYSLRILLIGFLYIALGYCSYFFLSTERSLSHVITWRGQDIRFHAPLVWVLDAAALTGYTMLAIIFDLLVQIADYRRRKKLDLAYYPRPTKLVSLLFFRRSRLVMVAGFLGLLGVWVYSHEVSWRGSDLGPGTMLSAWGILWLADCMNRPHKGTILAAVGYLLVVVAFPLMIGM